MEKTRLTKLEKYWILYDVGNSAFILLVSTIIPIYFDYLAGGEGLIINEAPDDAGIASCRELGKTLAEG